jgi:hypothetical protein
MLANLARAYHLPNNFGLVLVWWIAYVCSKYKQLLLGNKNQYSTKSISIWVPQTNFQLVGQKRFWFKPEKLICSFLGKECLWKSCSHGWIFVLISLFFG